MITLIVGRRIQGKTTLAYHEARQSPTILIFDPRGSFQRPGTPENEIYSRLDTAQEVVIHPEGNVLESFEQTCDELRDWIKDNPEEPVALLVDEARLIDLPSAIPQSFDWIIRFTTVKNVRVILTVHRPSDIAVDVRAIADYWCIFQTTQEHDLKVIGERCGDEVVAVVRQLGPHEFVVWNDAEAKYHVNREPAKWYVALSDERVTV